MATKTSGWKCTHSASIVSETNTTAKIKVTCYWENNGWTYNINHVSAWVYCNGESYKVKNDGSVDSTSSSKVSMGSHEFTVNKTTAKQSISCYGKITSESSYVSGTKSSTSSSVSVEAKPSHTISYDVTGGSGAPTSQTKWYDESIKLSSTVPVKTGHTFVSWCTNTSGTGTKYNPGDTYSSNANLTLYAIWKADTYTVTYDANSGSNAPSDQTKTYGVDLILSTTTPTRTNYNFLGWATSVNGSVVYESGATYTNDSDIVLYAVWEIAYIKPRTTNFDAQRCTSGGIIDDTGTYIKVEFYWTTDEPVSSIKIEWKTENGAGWSNSTVSASGRSGYVSKIIGNGAISIESAYLVRVYIADTNGDSYSPARTVMTPKYPIDVLKDGLGVAFGKAAETEDTAEFEFKARFNNGIDGDLVLNNGNINLFDTFVYINGEEGSISLGGDAVYMEGTHGSITLLDQIDIGNAFATSADVGYRQRGVMLLRHSGSNTILSSSTGGNVYIRPNGTSSDEGRVLFKTDGTITAYGGTTRLYSAKTLYENTSGAAGTITLSETVANYDHIEIFYAKGTDNNYFASSKIYKPDGKIASLITGYASNDAQVLTYVKTMTISGTSMTNVRCTRQYVKDDDTTGVTSDTDYIYVYKVLGYK